jgi:DNA-binding NtrC family response regulator
VALLLPNGKIRKTERSLIRPDLVRPLAEVKRDAIESALILCGGSRTLAAKQLEIAYRTVLWYVRKFRKEQ